MRYAAPRKYGYPSRYGIYRQIVDDKDTYTETVNKTIIAEKDSDIYHEVQMHEENRLDIISNKYYKTPDMWWVIAQANDMVDPFVLKSGTILRIPDFRSLYDVDAPFYGKA
jgi:hypothetical protein